MRRLVASLVVIAAVLTFVPPAAHADHHGALIEALTLPFTLPFRILSHLVPRVVVHPPPAVQAYPPPAADPGPVVYGRQGYAAPAYTHAIQPPPAPGPSPYGAPPSYRAPAYAPPPAAGSGVQAMSLRPAPSPAPVRTVQYANGRYELRGDGVSETYRWEWIPSAAESPAAAPAPR